MLRRWVEKAVEKALDTGVIKMLVEKALDEALEERATRVQAVTQALIEGNSKDCQHPAYGKWKEVNRYKITNSKDSVVAEKLSMERVCAHCGDIETKTITTQI